LTVLEQIVLLEYVKQKKDEETIVSEIMFDKTEELDNKLDNMDIGSLYKSNGF